MRDLSSGVRTHVLSLRSDVDHFAKFHCRGLWQAASAMAMRVAVLFWAVFAEGFPARRRARDFPGSRRAAAELIISTFMLDAHTYAICWIGRR
jgi:hypothetical protein